MNILVYDIAAEEGGAVSVLKAFYEQHKEDKQNRYVYLLSTYHLEETDNITVINVPQIKKSWFHRLAFDNFGAKKYIKAHQIDEVLSLQNMHLPCFKGKQTIYVHNALPFCEHKFSFKENKKMWIYQNVIGNMMKKSIKKADSVIVQTEWMREAIAAGDARILEKTKVQFPPVITIGEGEYSPTAPTCDFFYPASAETFKNHKLLFAALKSLQEQGVKEYTLTLTLTGEETAEIAELKKETEEYALPVVWAGKMPHEKVYEYYRKSILVFPSYIETVGLPIYEAMRCNTPLILADCTYTRGIKEIYQKVKYFGYTDADALAMLMKEEVLAYGRSKNDK